MRPGIVHRLDKGTSGVIVVAKNDFTHKALSDQFAKRTVKKEYRAVVLGRPEADKGRWDLTIGRHPVHRKKMSVKSRTPRQACTSFQVLAFRSNVAALALQIGTGRTHQIRVHCLAAGCPIAHDDVYGGIRRIKEVPDESLRKLLNELTRPALHAYRLSLVHPRSCERMVFTAPVPEDISRIMDAVGAGDE